MIRLALVLAAVFVCSSPAFAQEPDPGAMRLAEADEFFAQKRYPEAIAKYRECLAASPDRPTALYNGGLAAYQAGQFDVAVEWWERLHGLEPKDTGVLAKLVQAHQARGEREKRDATRAELLRQRAQLPEAERRKRERYCRDQFRVGDQRVMAFEYFELTGDRALRYRFSILDADGAEKEYVSLGSYEMTTRVARELEQIGKEDRLFHLDGYFGKAKNYAAFDVFKKEPGYDDVREAVIEIVKKRTEPPPKK